MEITPKIALYSLCILLALSWAAPRFTFILKAVHEKNSYNKKEALPTDYSEEEQTKFEIVSDFLLSSNTSLQDKIAIAIHFNKIITLPESVFLKLPNPPPEFHLFA